jgi:hypothetical protein
VLVTAAQVVAEMGVNVVVDPLPGGARRPACVTRGDELADLAMLVAAEAFAVSVGGLLATDSVALNT